MRVNMHSPGMMCYIVCVCVFVCCIEKYIHSCVHVQYINIYMQDCLYKHKSFLEPLGVVQFLKALGVRWLAGQKTIIQKNDINYLVHFIMILFNKILELRIRTYY